MLFWLRCFLAGGFSTVLVLLLFLRSLFRRFPADGTAAGRSVNLEMLLSSRFILTEIVVFVAAFAVTALLTER